eukprot:TRINITY_DN2490_c0_g1_i1.p1 TRINITY_DN2490_c0_g1~~TRINITY_DN2490_c0_g1_i1.p1  ORF type:complete len:284 (+),score=120.66 TRINITY_DN2490_c0_g1_i1:78-929(+)
MWRPVLALVAAAAGCVSGFRLPVATCRSNQMSRQLSMSTAEATAAAVDLSGDGGVLRRVVRRGGGKELLTGDIALVKYTGRVKDTGLVFAAADEYRCTLEDGTMISGWDIGLGGLTVGDKAVITCTSRYAYGSDGVPPVVPPGAEIDFELEVLEHEGNIMNPATFADANPLTPRTPESIRTEFDRKRQLQASMAGEEAEGMEKVKQWLKKIYIFGLFESLDGADAPWYLRPAITFPIMFAVCGVAFYCVVFLNGITTERATTLQDDPELAMSTAAYLLDQLRA